MVVSRAVADQQDPGDCAVPLDFTIRVTSQSADPMSVSRDPRAVLGVCFIRMRGSQMALLGSGFLWCPDGDGWETNGPAPCQRRSEGQLVLSADL
jgi:hypothetical protein